MAVKYELKTFDDLVDAVREELKIQESDTTSITRIKRNLNIIYQQEVAPYHRWKWLNGFVDLSFPAVITTGTADVTSNSVAVTLTSAPAYSVRGYWFSTDGYNERYRIAAHTAGSTSLVLEAPYTGTTDADSTYQIWTDRIALPADCRETIEVTQDHLGSPLQGVGQQEFRRYVNSNPKLEGRPQLYYTGEFVSPAPFDTISNLPALSTRASNGLIKTLVFASTVASLISVGDKIQVTAAGNYSYNIDDGVVSSISTTTITYTGRVPLNESATADLTLTVKKRATEVSEEEYRELHVYPAIHDSRVTLHVDYTKRATALVEDSDEPLIPLEDRVVLLYGALESSWARERNPEAAARVEGKFQAKLAKMAGKMEDSTDKPQLSVSKSYLSVKRTSRRTREPRYNDFSGSGAGSSPVITGTASRVATFNTSGELTASSSITTTELEKLDGIISLAVGISDTQTLTNKTLTLPIISQISNTGTLTLPTSTDTLVGRETVDTLSNKTLASPTITGQVSAANGTVSAPSYSFTNGLTTGMYYTGSDVLRFAAGGAQILQADSAGVYIPTTKIFRIDNGTAAAPSIAFQNATTTGLYKISGNAGLGFSIAGVTAGNIDTSYNWTAVGTSSATRFIATTDGSAAAPSILLGSDAGQTGLYYAEGSYGGAICGTLDGIDIFNFTWEASGPNEPWFNVGGIAADGAGSCNLGLLGRKFAANGFSHSTTGSTTNGSPTVTSVTVPSGAYAIWLGVEVGGVGIPEGTTITGISPLPSGGVVRNADGPVTLTLSNNATATGTPTIYFHIAPAVYTSGGQGGKAIFQADGGAWTGDQGGSIHTYGRAHPYRPSFIDFYNRGLLTGFIDAGDYPVNGSWTIGNHDLNTHTMKGLVAFSTLTASKLVLTNTDKQLVSSSLGISDIAPIASPSFTGGISVTGATAAGAKALVVTAGTAAANSSGKYGIQLDMSPITVATTGSRPIIGIDSSEAMGAIAISASNSAYYRKAWLSARRNSASDDGTLAELTGLFVEAGNQTGLSTNAVTTLATGITVQMFGQARTISTLYGIYIPTMATGGTVTTKYAIYSPDTSLPSLLAGGVRTKYATTNTANPPTQAEMVTAFGTAASNGAGFLGVLNDNAGGTNVYFVFGDGTNYFYVLGTVGA